ncbi:hypothetical protein ABB26_05205 [Stenotrophomonas humi]|uniref:Uncharacterized protein n=1 Tax=Stenotrophomonas humi TaxID=405444 RepID=A0A0R0CJ07_9GAMM|nr:hypothetical protein [Stenotrophomonas humi]KRG65203.1 hypothetical protein ABB26_05205 [Stenotrophomonas humi]
MNGYDAQDMATQGADGHRDGYQAGYADAVKAFDAENPVSAQEAVAINQFRHHDSSDWYDVTPEDHPHVFNDPDFVVRTVYAAPVAAAPVVEALKRIKLRLHFLDMPGESMWDRGDGVWVPDWRYEIQLIEHVLHGRPFTATEKPTDTRKRIEVASTPAAQGISLLNTAYFQGWVAAAGWASRDDIVADEGSKAYTAERDQRLHGLIDASPKADARTPKAGEQIADILIEWRRNEIDAGSALAAIEAHLDACTFQPANDLNIGYEAGMRLEREAQGASPKGGSDAESRFAFCAKHEAFPIRTEDGRNWIMFVATDPAYPNIRAAHVAATPEAAIDAAMQASSAEAGVMCATCQDSGEVIGQEGSGPDVYDVTVICPHCSQQATSAEVGS